MGDQVAAEYAIGDGTRIPRIPETADGWSADASQYSCSRWTRWSGWRSVHCGEFRSYPGWSDHFSASPITSMRRY